MLGNNSNMKKPMSFPLIFFIISRLCRITSRCFKIFTFYTCGCDCCFIPWVWPQILVNNCSSILLFSIVLLRFQLWMKNIAVFIIMPILLAMTAWRFGLFYSICLPLFPFLLSLFLVLACSGFRWSPNLWVHILASSLYICNLNRYLIYSSRIKHENGMSQITM